MYLRSTCELEIKYISFDPPLQLTCYVDVSWNATMPERKSWTDNATLLNCVLVFWKVKKQHRVSASPMKAEFVAAAKAVKEIKYLSTILSQILLPNLKGISVNKPILYINNTTAANYLTTGAITTASRYIHLQFPHNYYVLGQFDVKHIASKVNLANLLTKATPKDFFIKFCHLIMS